MLRWNNFSFPAKVIAIIIASVLIGLTYYVTQFLIAGEVTLSSAQSNAWAFHNRESTAYTLPHVFRLRPGRYVFTIGAEGYRDLQERVTIYPFGRQKRSVSLSQSAPASPSQRANNPFEQQLPYSDDQYFDVDFGDQSDNYRVTLHENESWYNNQEDYRRALVSDKKRALDWIKAQGADTQKLTIEWIPFDPGD